MNLRSPDPLWPAVDLDPARYERLDRDERCEVVVVGGGISGTLVAHALAVAGVEVVLVEGRRIGQGSTAATTGLLLYEIDTPLVELTRLHGVESARRVYRLCLETNREFDALVRSLGDTCGLERKQSLYLASSEGDVAGLRGEYHARQAIDPEVQWLDRRDVEAAFSLSAPAALRTPEARQIDAYRLAKRLASRVVERGGRVYEKTLVHDYTCGDDRVCLKVAGGASVVARRVVFATGYESQSFLPQQVVDLQTSFALATGPLEATPGWDQRCLIWETARPYLYLRSTPDGRAVMGGLDEPFVNPARRDAAIADKAAQLHARFSRMFPSIRSEVEYAWAGVFGQTRDGLPYIGAHRDFSLACFALGYGGNGITFSLIAADIIRDHHLGVRNANGELFRFDR